MRQKILQLIPSLENRVKTCVRVLPCQGDEPEVNATKLCGCFLWSQNEPWFYCDEPEAALHNDYNWDELVDEAGCSSSNIWSVSHPKHNDAFITILQVRSEDVPEMRFPTGKDIFQLLWCPRDHPSTHTTICRVVWRAEKEVQNIFESPPQPSHPENYDLTPEPSRIRLERVSEYPALWSLSPIERELLYDEDGGEGDAEYYSQKMNCAGIKIGGHPHWIQDPQIPVCECSKEMEHLLTIGSDIFEDYPEHKAPGLVIGDCGSIYIFICYECSNPPIKTVFQCS